jgi:hypothetical protein
MLNNTVALLGGATPPVVGDYESIATVTVGAGGSSSISFSSIAGTYKHLQIRCAYNTITNPDNIGMTLNGSVTPSRAHYVYGNGTSALAGDTTSNLFTIQAGASSTIMYGMVIDLLDYSNTNKNKTLRSLGGGDFNGSGVVWLSSALYATTSAVTSLTLQGSGGQSFTQYSSFALYGVK